VKILELLDHLFQFPDVILRVEIEGPSLLNTSGLHVEHVDLPPDPRLKHSFRRIARETPLYTLGEVQVSVQYGSHAWSKLLITV
jgi:hypothetical protein